MHTFFTDDDGSSLRKTPGRLHGYNGGPVICHDDKPHDRPKEKVCTAHPTHCRRPQTGLLRFEPQLGVLRDQQLL
jgi:hypothetical protein